MDNILEKHRGRPADTAGREERELRVYSLLESLGIEYYSIDHTPENKAEKCREIDSLLNIRLCKNLFLCNRQQSAFYLLMMPADKPFRTSVVSPQVQSSRLSFADEGHLLEFLDTRPGSVSIMGLMNDRDKRVKLAVDSELLSREWAGCHPCVNTASIRLKMSDIIQRFLPAVGHGYTSVTL